MKSSRPFYFLFLFAFVIACTKSDSMDASFCSIYTPGVVSLGIDKELSLEQSFDFINAQGVSIDEIFTVYYLSALPNDSIDYILSVLNSKPYINARGFSAVKDGSVYAYDGKVNVITQFFNMTTEAQSDWIATKVQLRLTEKNNLKSFLLKVPVGEEKFWVRQLVGQKNVAYAVLDCALQINPNP